MASPKSKTFRATLERLRSDLGWVIVRLPFDVKKTWGGSRVKVLGEVNGIRFRTSVFPQKDGRHFILINNKIQKAARVFLGNTAEFHLELDTQPRVVVVLSEFESILKQSKKLRAFFDSLTFSYRNAISIWISEPKSTATRRRRAEQIAERLLETMEAEQELPPLIQTAFDRNAIAREGWVRMTPRQRRGELMAIFHYRNPESRARRLQKTLDLAKQVAEKSVHRTQE
ncbi:MAG TPA: YdeI/OmpD-associated family protein [Terriglobales bacterium]|jgi:hypothetical protein|nr:YdeI/OmpD-associated family protein [Terriglobales bacterium]